jgi:thiamine biosynthesis lipoprotein ApbE
MSTIGAASTTVAGPDGWLCGDLATALMVVGGDGAKYFAQHKLVGYQPFVIARDENTTWSI